MKEILYSTKFLEFAAVKRENKPDWVYAHRPNAKDVVIIVPLIHRWDEDHTLFLITKRPPVTEEYGEEKYCVEFPAGLVGDEDADETTDMALKKELLEETGYEAEKFDIVIKNLVSSGGLTSEKSTLAIGEIYDLEKKTEPVDDGGVIIDRVEVPVSRVCEFLDEIQGKGCFMCAQTLAGVYFLLNKK